MLTPSARLQMLGLGFQKRFPSTGGPVPLLKNQEKGVLAKGVSAESSVTAKETKSTQGHWVQQCIWHSERHSQA